MQIPQPYPLALNQPLDRAYLRPLQEPLYDAEVIDYTTTPAALTFFQRPISQSTASALAGATSKDFSETNLNQSSMLDYPREFSVLGFNNVFDSTMGLESLATIMRRAYFQFTYSGRRPYLTIPLNRIPQGQSLTGAASSTIATAGGNSGLVAFGGLGIPHVANYYKFNLGRSALKIKPGEAFNTKIVFAGPLTAAGQGLAIPTTLNSAFGKTQTVPAGWWVHSILVGLSWQPL